MTLSVPTPDELTDECCQSPEVALRQIRTEALYALRQLAFVRKYAGNPSVCIDAANRGKAALERVMERLAEAGVPND